MAYDDHVISPFKSIPKKVRGPLITRFVSRIKGLVFAEKKKSAVILAAKN